MSSESQSILVHPDRGTIAERSLIRILSKNTDPHIRNGDLAYLTGYCERTIVHVINTLHQAGIITRTFIGGPGASAFNRRKIVFNKEHRDGQK